jgi:hypothetical protein
MKKNKRRVILYGLLHLIILLAIIYIALNIARATEASNHNITILFPEEAVYDL